MPELLSSTVGSPAADSKWSSSSAWRRWTRAAPTGAAMLAVIVIAVGAFAGLWFVPFAAGLAIGLATRRRRLRSVLPVTVTVAATGWAVPLAWQAADGEPIVATAKVVAALAGVPASAGLVLAATLLVPVIQALAGAWLGRVVRKPAKA